jgi:dTDP-4-dehydrorhamnose 3,5-epimerase
MEIINSAIKDVKIISPKIFYDERGYFFEAWNEKEFINLGITVRFVQDNQSRSIKNTLRGLHYQLNNPQGKLVRVLQGEIFDVALDLRKNSNTFGKWVGIYLSEHNKKMLWIPPGFAHGFYVTSESADIFYKCTEHYKPDDEKCIHWADKELAIEWPLEDEIIPLISKKDEKGDAFMNSPHYINI